MHNATNYTAQFSKLCEKIVHFPLVANAFINCPQTGAGHSAMLLPQDLNSIILGTENKLRVLRLLQFFTQEAIETFKDFFIKRDMGKFDPHVGETSCHLRAYKIYLLANSLHKTTNLNQIKRKIMQLTNIYSGLNKSIMKIENISKASKKSMKLYDFLQQQNCLFELSSDEIYLVRAHFLTKYKKTQEDNSSKINFDLIAHDCNISRKLAKKIGHAYQVSLAKESSVFIQTWFDGLPKLRRQKKMIEKFTRYDDDCRLCLPRYLVAKLMMQHLLYQRAPILFCIRNRSDEASNTICLLFVPSFTKKTYVLRNKISHADLSKRCLIFHGVSDYNHANSSTQDYIKAFDQLGPCNIILGNMASHPQYSGLKLAKYSHDPYGDALTSDTGLADEIAREHESLLGMRSISLNEGCCKENQKLFFIRHIFCDTVGNQLGADCVEKDKVIFDPISVDFDEEDLAY